MTKKYNPLKEVRTNIGMITTESIGYGVGFKIAGSIDTSLGSTKASEIMGVGSSLAGIPSLTHASGSVLRSLEMLDYGKKKKK